MVNANILFNQDHKNVAGQENHVTTSDCAEIEWMAEDLDEICNLEAQFGQRIPSLNSFGNLPKLKSSASTSFEPYRQNLRPSFRHNPKIRELFKAMDEETYDSKVIVWRT